jgi:RNA polymerase sigma-70 factor (ECF subfamily)
LRRVAGGDSDALAALYDLSSPLVFGLAVRILGNQADAEEVTLDVFTQVWRAAASFDPSRASVAGWLVMLTRSRAIDRLRSRAERDGNESQPIHYPEPRSRLAHPEEESFLNQQRRIVDAALSAIAPEQRQLIEMAFFLGLSHSELAVRTGLPLGTIKTRIRLGMIKLKELLAPVGEGLLRRQ